MPRELYEQMRHHGWSLVGRRGRPSQIALLRAVSAGYYALFHLLVHATTARLVQSEVPGLRARVGRVFQHGEMKEVCSWFGKASPPDRLKALLTRPIDEDLRFLAGTFTELQRTRHEADYDSEAVFVQSDIIKLLESVDEAFACWERIAYTSEAEVFLTALAFGKRWDR